MNNENKNSEKSEDNLNPSKFSSQDISKFLKPQLIAELTKRNLITTGTVPELKNRLTQYLNGETTPNDFINTFNANKMDNTKKPYYKPNTFSGLISENIDTFIKKYNRAASINGWSDEEKIKFLPLYLEGPALTFYDNNESNLINDIKWADLENILLSEFKPTAQLDMLKLLLQKRKQLDDEQTINYVNEIESLCKRINPTMLESEIIHTVIKGLKPNIIRQIGIMENNTIKQLKDNLRKFDLIEFMVTGELDQSQTEIKNSIVHDQINKITEKFNEQLKISNENNEKLNKKIENLLENKNSNTNKNTFFRNPNLVKQNHFLNQNYTNNKIQNCEICLLNNHTTATCFRNKNNIQPQQCKVCLKNNHRTENCYFNNKPTITCQICDKAGHSAKTSNITDRCSPSSPEFPKYKYKINNITEPLYIKATLNNITIPVTIDTGANICCIRHTLMPPNSNLKKEPIILTGANNKPLTLFGSILIKLKINSHEFEIKAYVIENLSCHIIIGNKFLYQYNANINFKNSTLTLRKNNNDNKINNDIIIQTYNVYNSNNVHNIKEDVKNIFQTNSEYSIAHCISADLKMNKGLAAQIKNKFGDASAQLKNLKPMVGEAIPINMGNRTIYYLITKQKYFLKPTYDNIKTTLQNLKKTMNKLHDYKIAIPTIAAGLNKRNWSMTKQLIYHEFQNSNIELLICHKNTNNITNSWKTKEHEKIINLIHDHYHYNKIIKNINNINDNFYNKTKLYFNNPNINKNINHDTDNINKLESIYYDHNVNDNNEIKSIFNNYKPGENVLGDGNCGLYALCNALNDNKQKKITSIGQLLELLQLSDLPGHWWSDNELASIASYYNHDTYIFDENTKTAVVYRNKNNKRPPIILYNTNENTHWIPGTKAINPSLKIPHDYVEINDFTPLQQIVTEINNKYKNTKKPITNDKLKEIDKVDKIHIKTVDNITKSITNDPNKEIIYDSEGTPINISHELDPLQYSQMRPT
ncbi:hypothetical protein AGLY_001829 [Aphis glycines]|uniref:Retrotransposon gag domain-containing protein n=1 Tax=Aphis glycines TaxID=307491 RepID=A0A6G0U5T8_APHGL|nr:hypothetical protein AGLY_001829 [Aphis glycines]